MQEFPGLRAEQSSAKRRGSKKQQSRDDSLNSSRLHTKVSWVVKFASPGFKISSNLFINKTYKKKFFLKKGGGVRSNGAGTTPLTNMTQVGEFKYNTS